MMTSMTSSGTLESEKNKSDKTKRSGPSFPVSSRGKRPRSEMEIGGMHHMPKRENYKSEYSHTIYSNTRNRVKSKNKELHQRRKEEALKRKKSAMVLVFELIF